MIPSLDETGCLTLTILKLLWASSNSCTQSLKSRSLPLWISSMDISKFLSWGLEKRWLRGVKDENFSLTEAFSLGTMEPCPDQEGYARLLALLCQVWVPESKTGGSGLRTCRTSRGGSSAGRRRRHSLQVGPQRSHAQWKKHDLLGAPAILFLPLLQLPLDLEQCIGLRRIVLRVLCWRNHTRHPHLLQFQSYWTPKDSCPEREQAPVQDRCWTKTSPQRTAVHVEDVGRSFQKWSILSYAPSCIPMPDHQLQASPAAVARRLQSSPYEPTPANPAISPAHPLSENQRCQRRQRHHRRFPEAHTLAAAGHISSVIIPTHCRICGFTASMCDAAVWATKPLWGSRKIWCAAAWRTILRTTCSGRPDVVAISAKETSSPSGTLVANLNLQTACRLIRALCCGILYSISHTGPLKVT